MTFGAHKAERDVKVWGATL